MIFIIVMDKIFSVFLHRMQLCENYGKLIKHYELNKVHIVQDVLEKTAFNLPKPKQTDWVFNKNNNNELICMINVELN